MTDYNNTKCPKCGNTHGIYGLHCMKCVEHRGPAMHMCCPKCKREWVIKIKPKEEK